MHLEQKQYCESIKQRFPEHFKKVNVLDVGSLDINGNNRYLFENYKYTGIDVGEGPNVDIICPVHKFKPGIQYDVLISTEMLEHDKYKNQSLEQMFNLVKPGGLIIITAATDGRKEHGTHTNEPLSSPFTNDFYEPVRISCFTSIFLPQNFIFYEISISMITTEDIRFTGIKKRQWGKII